MRNSGGDHTPGVKPKTVIFHCQNDGLGVFLKDHPDLPGTSVLGHIGQGFLEDAVEADADHVRQR